MNERLKTILLYLLDARSIILGFAVFNFSLIWVWDGQITFACVACPWFHPWSYSNEPTILLVAALFLRINRWWGYTIAVALSGYIIGYAVYLFSIVDDAVAGLRADWKIIRMFYPYIVGSWDSQYLFALVILCCSTSYLARDILRRTALRRTALRRTANNNSFNPTQQ
jgi:hypothetical protein